MFIVSYGDDPIGYQQSYDPHAEADHRLRDQPIGTRGIDQFIGEPDIIGRGHGSAFIRVFVDATVRRRRAARRDRPQPAQCAGYSRLCQGRVSADRPAA